MAATGEVKTVAGSGTAANGTSGSALAAGLSSPSGVAVDSSGNCYIADKGNALIKCGAAVTTADTCGQSSPTANTVYSVASGRGANNPSDGGAGLGRMSAPEIVDKANGDLFIIENATNLDLRRLRP